MIAIYGSSRGCRSETRSRDAVSAVAPADMPGDIPDKLRAFIRQWCRGLYSSPGWPTVGLALVMSGGNVAGGSLIAFECIAPEHRSSASRVDKLSIHQRAWAFSVFDAGADGHEWRATGGVDLQALLRRSRLTSARGAVMVRQGDERRASHHPTSQGLASRHDGSCLGRALPGHGLCTSYRRA